MRDYTLSEITMKKILLLALALAMCLSLASCAREDEGYAMPRLTPDSPMKNGTAIINPDSEVRGVWIATVFNIDYPSFYDLPAAQLKAEIDAIIETCKKGGLNTIFFQVRPSCDALYDSDIFPVSRVLSTTGRLQFDPLEYFVEAAHRNNIFLHAWINPLRITVSADSEDKLPADSPAVKHPEWTVKYADGKLYFNAGIPDVRKLVADGVREIVENYNVDGIVFDDYFYPYPTAAGDPFDDADAYAKYGSSFDNVADFRRDSINRLIKLCYDTVKDVYADCLFGVSPGGVWQNNNGVNGGSDTWGFETYHSLYCDTLAWVNGGYVDYVSPQIYWTFDTTGTPYGHLIDWWNAKLDGTGVKLWVSHGAYRYEEGDWTDPAGEMTSQIEYAREVLSYRGSVFYGYDELRGNDFGILEELTDAYGDEIIYCDPSASGMPVSITSHYYGAECAVGEATLAGISDPSETLLVNGATVNRKKNGSFTVDVKLVHGENKFVFKQGDATFTLVLYGK